MASNDTEDFVLDQAPPIVIQRGEDDWLILSNAANDLMSECGAAVISIEGDSIYALKLQKSGNHRWVDIVEDQPEEHPTITRLK